MRFYEFGDKKLPVILLLPGTCCHWNANFGEVIPLLVKKFCVICASYDGFDETESTVFPDMLTETAKIEAYVKENFGGHICAAYGCSLGGSFVGLLVERGSVLIDHAILGSSDLDQGGGLSAKLKGKIMVGVLAGILQTGKPPGWLQKRLNKKPPEDKEYYEKFIRLFCGGSMAFVKKQSVYNQFYSDLVTPIGDDISSHGTTVHCFYAEKMGEKYLDRYRKHFANPDIRRHNLQHEELLMRYPEKWAEEVLHCCAL
ncbi:MAG: 2-hydroxy-6-oxo-6-phenylhexa-2,4-dienoate hydrolase [Oscillospiraceae bacterium]|nr:2-hydroxy-6-oxo-6-phenylhexa-2,4-dienoate hydrolase [Oscillospiraceae bacterium]